MDPKAAQDRIRALMKNYHEQPAVRIADIKPRLRWRVSEDKWTSDGSTQTVEGNPIHVCGEDGGTMFAEWKHETPVAVQVRTLSSGYKRMDVTLCLKNIRQFVYTKLGGQWIIKWASGGQALVDVVKLVVGSREFVVHDEEDYKEQKEPNTALWNPQNGPKAAQSPLQLVITVEGGHHKDNEFEMKRTFSETFGSDTVSIEFRAIEGYVPVLADICNVIEKEVWFGPKDFVESFGEAAGEIAEWKFNWKGWEETVLEKARRSIAGRSDDTGLFELVCADNTTIRVAKSVLLDYSPMFAACFRNADCVEMKNNSFDLSGYSRMAVENFVFYAEGRFIPDIDEVYVELVRLAHFCQTPSLVSLCELCMMNNLAIWTVKGVLLDERMDDFIELCKVANLLELPLLLALIHMVLLDETERTIIQDAKLAAVWCAFADENPRFLLNRYKAVLDLSKEPHVDVVKTASSKKRKLDDKDSA